jgi:hypothetical protein
LGRVPDRDDHEEGGCIEANDTIFDIFSPVGERSSTDTGLLLTDLLPLEVVVARRAAAVLGLHTDLLLSV